MIHIFFYFFLISFFPEYNKLKYFIFKDIQEASEKFFWPKQVSEVDTNEPKQEEDEEDVIPINGQLEILNFYLRQTYNYCVYCGIVYDDETDLMEECPGPNRQDH